MRFVASSAVAALGYDRRRRELFVNFVGARPTYVYLGVSPGAYVRLLRASSIGAYLNRRIKPVHPHRQLDRRL